MKTVQVSTKDKLYMEIYRQAKYKHEDLLILEAAYSWSGHFIGFDFYDNDGGQSWYQNVVKADTKYEFITTI